MQRILFLSDDREDYLADSLLHGLISLGGHQIIDYPKKEILYLNSFTSDQRNKIYGRGFTLYGLLPERSVDRTLIWKRLETGWFDLVILGNVWRQFGMLSLLSRLMQHLPTRLLVLDGDDDPRLYPVSFTRIREHGLKLPGSLRALTKRSCYFKRELDERQPQHWRELAIPAKLRPSMRKIFNQRLIQPRQCSFSIPAQWIRQPNLSLKDKLLPSHVVDSEICNHFKSGTSTYAFLSQQDYFDDLAQARFGITTKRAGWDCLRHYEIAAAGSVPCFRGLRHKPAQCAPHGLSSENCVIYESAADLARQLEAMPVGRYAHLLEASHHWVQQYTTVQAAARLLEESNT
jgi:hypothetical protein